MAPPALRAACVVLAVACLASLRLPCALAACSAGINLSMQNQAMDMATTISLIKQSGATSIKIFSPDPKVFKALSGTGMEVVVGIQPDDMMTTFANNGGAADKWLKENILPWIPQVNIRVISVANERLQETTGDVANHVVDGMWALYYALKNHGLQDQIKVMTPQQPGFLRNTIPPSNAIVVPALTKQMSRLLDFVTKTGSSLFLTAYPFFQLKSNPKMDPDFALFKNTKGYYDGQYYYQNSLDEVLDQVLVAVTKLGYPNVPIQVAETGWPSGGDGLASTDMARQYYQNLMGKICSGQGTPRRPGHNVRTWVFEIFDEPWKGAWAPYEAHFGIRNTDGSAKYSLNLAGSYSAPPQLPPQKWCVVKGNADGNSVTGTIKWACSSGTVDCGKYSGCNGGMYNNAIFNEFFQKYNQDPSSCDFDGAGAIIDWDPSNGSCKLPGRPS